MRLWQVATVAAVVLSIAVNLTASLQMDSRRIDLINEWIDRIRSAPKGHSMSPSWTSKSLGSIKPLGVGVLPLQNERVDSYPLQFSSNHNRNHAGGFKRPVGGKTRGEKSMIHKHTP